MECTNGDVLSSKMLQNLYLSINSSYGMYDGPIKLKNLKNGKKSNVPDEMLILRDRWYGLKTGFWC